MQPGTVGIVRLLDRQAGHHVYRVGTLDGGELAGELGSLRAEERPGTSPLWISDEGRAFTPDYRPLASVPSLALLARWIAAPARWRGAGSPGRRARAILWRCGAALRARRGPGQAPPPAGPPVGFLDREPGSASVPLYSAVHPVTADQLLSTDPWEPRDLGYGESVLLGYLRAIAPLTGRLGVDGPELLWASRFGTGNERRRRGLHACLDQPAPDGPPRELPFRISGWALAQPGVSRVEVAVDGRVVGRARFGVPRPDVAAMRPDPDAPACGFEYVLGSAEVAPGADRIEVAARVVSTAGDSFSSPRVTVALVRPTGSRVSRNPEAHHSTAAASRRSPVGEPPAGDDLNLLAVTHDIGYGGAQLYLAELLARLVRDHGAAATVATPVDGPLSAALSDAGVGVHLTGRIPLDDEQRYEAKLAELASWARGRGFSHVLANTLGAFPGVELARELGASSLLALHESFDLERFWVEAYPGTVNRRVQERARRAVREADAVVFEAEATRRLFLPHGDAARLQTLPYAIELEWIDRFRAQHDAPSLRRELGLDPEATVLLCLGTFDPRKAQIPLLRAFASVAEEHPDATLVLVGEGQDARYAAALRDVAARCRIGDRVRLLPTAADPRPWQAAADVVICASDVESLPRVVLEAMAFQKPVLATDVFGLPEVVTDEVTGWLCEPRDTAALADGLDRALGASPARRREIGRAGAELVHGRHEPAAYAARVAALLRDRGAVNAPARAAGAPAPARAGSAGERHAPRAEPALARERARRTPEWPPGRPRILITDAWLANAGDAAIALATDRRVRRLVPGAAVLHAAYQGDLLASELPDLDLVPPLAGLTGVRPEIPEMIGWDAGAADEFLARTDAVLSQGGGFLIEHYRQEDRMHAWEAALEREIPFALCAQSIGPYREPRSRDLLARQLRAARAVGVREETSRANVAALGVAPERIVVGADEAFSLFEQPPVETRRRGLAIVLSAHPVTRAGGEVAHALAPGELAELLGALLEVDAAHPLTLLSSQQGLGLEGRGLEDDAELAENVLAELPTTARRLVRRIDGYLSPHRVAEVLARHRALLTMRMHPALIGMSRGTPSVVMSEAFKADAVFRELGLGNLLVDRREAAVAVAAALTDREPGRAQWLQLGEGRKRARRNDLVLERLLAGESAPPSLPQWATAAR